MFNSKKDKLKKLKKLKKRIEKSGLFDKIFYLKDNPDIRTADILPIDHYVQHGIRENRKPNKDFDPIWYKEYYKDVQNDELDAFSHYILFGRAENRFQNASFLSHKKERLYGFINTESYLEVNTDLKDIENQVGHFISCGYDEIKNGLRRLGNEYPFYNEHEYLTLNPDIKKAVDNNHQFNAFDHFIEFGCKEFITNTRQIGGYYPIESSDEFIETTIIPVIEEKIYTYVTTELTEEENAEYYIIQAANLNWDDYIIKNMNSVTDADPIIDYIKKWRFEEPVIPGFFDTNFYLAIYPDIKDAKMNPLLHYVTLGQTEGRQALFKDENILKGKIEFDDKKETIIFASHESSASGAPLLGYNIADKLIEKYNIVHMIIKKSDIHESFLDNCFLMFYGFENNQIGDSYIFIKRLKEKRNIKAIICNSVVTHEIISAAYTLNIPSVLLIHEFTDYIKPVATVMNTIILADKVILPAKIIQNSVQEEFIKYSNNKEVPTNIHIFPQGKLPYIPEAFGDNDSIETLCKKMKIKSIDEAKIIVGSGWVQIRKGVDLFIATAKQIKKNSTVKCKFVWIGGGYNPEADLAYSAWLKREIEYSGLDDDFIFLEHQKNLDTIFSISDVFCLTSRMDPFPNVVIDALGHDLHIACFENASGSSEFLQRHNANCSIVEYLDTTQLAKEVNKYLSTENTKKGINTKIVEDHLNFNNYVDNIDKLMAEAIEFKRTSNNIINELLINKEFDSQYFAGDNNESKHCRTYVETSLKGIYLQNPKPGFSQKKYLIEHKNIKNTVPLYEAMKNSNTRTHDTQEVPYHLVQNINFFYAVHLHLFYVDLAEEFASYFKNLPGKFDILITIVNEEDRDIAQEVFSQCGANDVKIVYVKNIGRDSGPLFFGLKDIILENNYEVIGHFHTKKSFDINDGIGNKWRKYLTETLIGNTDVAKSVLGLFNTPKIGLIFPDDSHVVDIGENKEYIDDLCKMMHIKKPITQTAIFPIGNMFWARLDAIKDLFILDPNIVLQEEPLPYDGSYMHAIERISPDLVEKNGYSYTTVYKKGIRW